MKCSAQRPHIASASGGGGVEVARISPMVFTKAVHTVPLHHVLHMHACGVHGWEHKAAVGNHAAAAEGAWLGDRQALSVTTTGRAWTRRT